jgi:hypothetical protein
MFRRTSGFRIGGSGDLRTTAKCVVVRPPVWIISDGCLSPVRLAKQRRGRAPSFARTGRREAIASDAERAMATDAMRALGL